MEKNVVVFGGTGLIGNLLIELLSEDTYFDSIKVFTRRPTHFSFPKIKNEVLDFSDRSSFEKGIEKDDIVFSALGTTQSKVKRDKKVYRSIDFDMCLNIGKACKVKNASSFLFVSSSGANASSSNFYLKLKGEIENAVLALNLPNTQIVRPSLLLGSRKEYRLGERIAQYIMPKISFLFPPSMKPISALQVAKVLIDLSKKGNLSNTKIIENNTLLRYKV